MRSKTVTYADIIRIYNAYIRIYADKKRPIAHMRPHYLHMRKVRENSSAKEPYYFHFCREKQKPFNMNFLSLHSHYFH